MVWSVPGTSFSFLDSVPNIFSTVSKLFIYCILLDGSRSAKKEP